MNSKAHISENPLEQAAAWKREGKQVALATVVSTWGSAPRPAGSQLAISKNGEFAGSVSGGCIEGTVIAEADDIIASGAPKLMEFGVSNSQAWEVGLACGGKIQVFIERID